MTDINPPAVTMTAIGNGRKITLNRIGLPALLIFHGRNTSEAVRSVNGPVRDEYPSAEQLLVISIADLHVVPGLLRGVVQAFIKDAYEEAIQELPQGWEPIDYLLILPDWDGKVTKAFQMKNTDGKAGLAVLDGNAKVLGTYQGDNLANQALKLLEKAMI